MSNQRSVMTEFRLLDQKRQAGGLTAEEATRYAQLRDLVGPETASPPRAGFDVNAAAARLRESLLPAGLRARPAEAAPPPPLEPPPAPAPAPAPEALALEEAWAQAPFAALEAQPPTDPLFDPGSLASEVRPQAWNPEAPGYDPNAPYDEAAWIAAGYDPNATYDWSAYGYGPDGQPLAADAGDATAAAPAEVWAEPLPGVPVEPEPVAGVALEAALEVVEPPLESPQELGELPAEAAAAPLDADLGLDGVPVEAAPEAWGAADVAMTEAPGVEAAPEPPWDAAAEPPPEPPPEAGVEQDWGAPAATPEPELSIEDAGPAPDLTVEPAPAAEEVLPFDPNAPFDHAKWFGRPHPEEAPVAAEPAGPDLSFDLEPEPAAPAAPAFGEYDEAGAPPLAPAGEADLLEAAPAPAEPPLELGLGEPPAAPAPPEAAGDWLGEATPLSYEPAPAGAPFGEYDEAGAPLPGAPAADGSLESMLPFDPAAASAIEQGALPEGYEPGGPALDPASLPPVDTGGYDDTAFSADQMYGGPEGDSLPGGAPLELEASMPDWQPETALEHGFELASDGSFGEREAPVARTPAWGTAIPASPGEGWANAPALDLGSPFEAPAEAPVDLLATAPAPAAEELPTIDGAELLEELPPEAPPPALELGGTEPLAGQGISPLDGAFEEEAAVEAAAYPPPDLDGTPALAVEAHAEPEPAVSYDQAEALPPEIAAAYGGAAEPLQPDAAPPEAAPPAGSDTFELPPAVAEGLFEAAPEPDPEPLEAEPLPPPPPTVEFPGTHRVVLHTVDGQVKRGLLVDALLDATTLPLQPQGPGTAEEIPTEGIKAIFFMLAPGEKAPSPEGKKVRVTFRDGRQVAGYSPDYEDGLAGFFMIPADTRTNTGRIWVYQSAVKSVAVS